MIWIQAQWVEGGGLNKNAPYVYVFECLVPAIGTVWKEQKMWSCVLSVSLSVGVEVWKTKVGPIAHSSCCLQDLDVQLSAIMLACV